MNTTMPWWGSGLFTVVGAVVTAVGALVLGLLNRRSERRRLSRERKETDYPELASAANTLAQLPVWPAEESDPRAQHVEIHKLAQRIAFFSPQKVTRTLTELLGASDQLAKTITKIRTNSRPTHDNRIDQRYAEQYSHAVSKFEQAITTFAAAARADLEIRTPYSLVRTGQPTRTTNARPESKTK